ncbi:MAG: hypothetical protein J07HX64_02838 [halophilic archaeon J07HX64]|nr:MAG: hypothetical protein J07HX64_02838 [halophilic archaeon J07HX64]
MSDTGCTLQERPTRTNPAATRTEHEQR